MMKLMCEKKNQFTFENEKSRLVTFSVILTQVSCLTKEIPSYHDPRTHILWQANNNKKIKQFRYAISPMQTNYKDQRWRFLPVSHIISYFLGINLRFQKSSATRSISPNSVIYMSRLLNKLKKVRKIVDWEGPHQV